jgi:filamentous hemagglutinin
MMRVSVPQTPQTAGGWSAPKGWRLPANDGEWSGTAGNSLWKSNIAEVNQMTGNRAIAFKNGHIDLSYYKAAEYKFPNLTGTRTDFNLADAQLALDRGFNSPNAARVWRSQNGLTWHHVEDGRRLQLVPTVLNDIPHQGGASILRGN